VWWGVAPAVAAATGREVFAVDWPGMGYSETWPGGATPRHKADQIVAMLDHWGIERAALVGMDMGGQPALVCAARHPDRIERVAVLNSLLFGDLATSWEIEILRKYGWNRWLIRKLPGLVFERAVRTSIPRDYRLPPELRADFRTAFMRPEVGQYVSKMCAGYQGKLPDLPADYAAITCPTAIIWGAQDKHFPPAHGERLAALLPHATLTVLPGHHWLPLHAPAAVAAALIPSLTTA